MMLSNPFNLVRQVAQSDDYAFPNLGIVQVAGRAHAQVAVFDAERHDENRLLHFGLKLVKRV
jgi:hypothetical protein